MRNFFYYLTIFFFSLAIAASETDPIGLHIDEAIDFLASQHADAEATMIEAFVVNDLDKKCSKKLTTAGKIALWGLVVCAVPNMPGFPIDILTATWCFGGFAILCSYVWPATVATIGLTLTYAVLAVIFIAPISNAYARYGNGKLSKLSLELFDSDPTKTAVIDIKDFPDLAEYLFKAPAKIKNLLSLSQMLELYRANPNKLIGIAEEGYIFSPYVQKQAGHLVHFNQWDKERQENFLTGRGKNLSDIDEAIYDVCDDKVQLLTGLPLAQVLTTDDNSAKFNIKFDKDNIYADLENELTKEQREKIDIFIMYNGIPESLLKQCNYYSENSLKDRWEFCDKFKFNKTQKTILRKIELTIRLKQDIKLFELLGALNPEAQKQVFTNYSLDEFEEELHDPNALNWYGNEAIRYSVGPLIDKIKEFCKIGDNAAVILSAWPEGPPVKFRPVI